MDQLHAPVTYTELVLGALRRWPGREAFRQGDRALTYAQVGDTLARWATVFRGFGLGHGGGVGVLSPNCPEVWLAQVAPALVGGRFTALHPLGSFEDHLYACDEAELRLLLVDPRFAEHAAGLAEKSPAVERVLTFGPATAGEDLMALAEAATPGPLDPGPHGPEDIAFLLYTGGTTGVPKAAELTEQGLAQMVLSLCAGWDMPKCARYLAAGPITHAATLPIIPTLVGGGTVILLDHFDPALWLETVARERVNLSLLVPTMIYALLDSAGLDAADLSSLETVIYGAAPMSPDRLVEAIERVGPVFSQIYGQTECIAVATALWRDQHDPTDVHRLTSCGQPIPGGRVVILDADGQEAPVGQTGEICIQGPGVMKGYYKQPELTAEALAGGWLHTGDMAYRDEEGFFYIVDRKKEMIVSGGFNVFPREIEDVLCSHPAVSMAAVIGVPDDKWGEAVKALVVVRPGAEAAPEELIALVRERKGPVYTPKTVDLVESLPMTPVGKVDKKVLRGRYWSTHDRQVN